MVGDYRRHPVKQSRGELMAASAIPKYSERGDLQQQRRRVQICMYSYLQQTEQGLHDGQTRWNCTADARLYVGQV